LPAVSLAQRVDPADCRSVCWPAGWNVGEADIRGTGQLVPVCQPSGGSAVELSCHWSGDLPVGRITDLPVHRSIGFLIYWSTGFLIHWSTGYPVYRSSDLPVFRFSGFPVFRSIGFPVNR